MASSIEERLIVENIVRVIHEMPADPVWPWKRKRNGRHLLPLPVETTLVLFVPDLLDETITYVSAETAGEVVHFDGAYKDAILRAIYSWEQRSVAAYEKAQAKARGDVFKKIWKAWSEKDSRDD